MSEHATTSENATPTHRGERTQLLALATLKKLFLIYRIEEGDLADPNCLPKAVPHRAPACINKAGVELHEGAEQ